MKTEIREQIRHTIIISITKKQHKELLKKLGNDKHSFLICFEVGGELKSVKAMLEPTALGITDTIKELGCKELFTLEHGGLGVDCFYSTLDGKFDRIPAILKIKMEG